MLTRVPGERLLAIDIAGFEGLNERARSTINVVLPPLRATEGDVVDAVIAALAPTIRSMVLHAAGAGVDPGPHAFIIRSDGGAFEYRSDAMPLDLSGVRASDGSTS